MVTDHHNLWCKPSLKKSILVPFACRGYPLYLTSSFASSDEVACICMSVSLRKKRQCLPPSPPPTTIAFSDTVWKFPRQGAWSVVFL